MTFQSYLLLSYFFFFVRCCPLSLSIKSMARFGGTHQILMDFINASSTGFLWWASQLLEVVALARESMAAAFLF